MLKKNVFSNKLFKHRLFRNMVIAVVSILLVLALYSAIKPDFHKSAEADNNVTKSDEADKNANPVERRVISAYFYDHPPLVTWAEPTGNEFFISDNLTTAMEEYEGQEDVCFNVLIRFILPHYVEGEKADEMIKQKEDLLKSLGAELKPIEEVMIKHTFGYSYSGLLSGEAIRELEKRKGFQLELNTSKSDEDFNQKIYDELLSNPKLSPELKEALAYSHEEDLIPVDVLYKENYDDNESIDKEVEEILGYSLGDLDDEYNKNPDFKDEYKEKADEYYRTRVNLFKAKHSIRNDDFLKKYPHFEDRVISKPSLFPAISLKLYYDEIIKLSEDESLASIDYYPYIVEEILSEGN